MEFFLSFQFGELLAPTEISYSDCGMTENSKVIILLISSQKFQKQKGKICCVEKTTIKQKHLRKDRPVFTLDNGKLLTIKTLNITLQNLLKNTLKVR